MSITRLVMLSVLSVAACGGGGAGTDAGPGVDASPPVITEYSLKGVYPLAEFNAHAIAPDAVIFRANGAYIAEGGVLNLSILQSFWTVSFISPSNGTKVDVLFAMDQVHVTSNQDNPEGKKLFPSEWMDSTQAIEKAVSAGFVEPTVADPYTRVDVVLEMYGGIDPGLQGAPEPLWRISRITVEPGMQPVGEDWLVTHWPGLDPAGDFLVCAPAGCGVVP